MILQNAAAFMMSCRSFDQTTNNHVRHNEK